MSSKSILALFTCVLVLSACGSDAENDGGAAAPDTTTTIGVSATTTVATAPDGPVSAEIDGFLYEPDPIQAAVGAELTWTNLDGFAHTVTAQDGAAVEFDSGDIAENETFSITFDEAGEYRYFCTIHNQMKGTVVVS